MSAKKKGDLAIAPPCISPDQSGTLGVYARDLDFDLGLAVADLFVIALTPLVLLGGDFWALGGADDVGGDGCAADEWHTDVGFAAACNQQDAIEGNRLLVLVNFT